MGFPGVTSGKESTCQCRRCKRRGMDPWVGKIPWSKKWQPIPVFLPGKPHGQRSLAGYSPWGFRVRCDWAHVHSILTCFQDSRGETNKTMRSIILQVPKRKVYRAQWKKGVVMKRKIREASKMWLSSQKKAYTSLPSAFSLFFKIYQYCEQVIFHLKGL